MRVALIQMKVNPVVEKCIEHVENTIKDIKPKNPDFVVLPEMFCCPYDENNFPIYAEEEGGDLDKKLSSLAKENNIYLVAGSVPEREGDDIFNTSYVYDRKGNKIAKHRKVHLFEIHSKKGQRFRESDTLTAGDEVTVFDTEFGKVGLAICFDIRFPELFRSMADKGAKVVFVPAAFNMTTGPAHWSTLFKARTIDNQIFVAGISSAKDDTAKYKAYGHTLIVDPWGTIKQELEYDEGVIVEDIDLDMVEDIRRQLPILDALKREVY